MLPFVNTNLLRPEDARLLLAEIERARRATRYRIGEYSWISFAVWAGVFGGAAIVGPRTVWYWVAAVPVALVSTAIVDKRLSGLRTARRADWRYWAVGGAIAVASFGGGWFLPIPFLAGWTWFVLGMGFAGFAWLDHHRRAALVLWALACLALLALGLDADPELVYRGLAAVFAVWTAATAGGMKP